MQYDLEYHKSLDRSHILPNILQGAQTGIFSQFISDIILSLLAIIITFPIFIITGILVMVFLGRPAIFRQQRPGKDGKVFTLYKFRTMTNKKDKDGNLLPDEKRLTKFGKF